MRVVSGVDTAPGRLGEALRYDALIAGAGPTGALTALLAKASGLRVVVAEAGPAQYVRPQLARFSGDAQRALARVGVDGMFPPTDPRAGSTPLIAPLQDVTNALRASAARDGVEVHYGATYEALEHSGAGVRAVLDGRVVEAPVLLDASGGALLRGHPTLGLQHTEGEAHVIGLQWDDIGRHDGSDIGPRVAEAPQLRMEVGAGSDAVTFNGFRDPERGTFGTIELDREPTADDVARIARASGAALGIDGDPSLLTSFSTRNRIAPRAAADGVLLLGDSVTKLRPRTGQGVNLGLVDAQDAVRLVEDLARRVGSEQASAHAAMLRDQIFTTASGAIMKRHKAALHTDLIVVPGINRGA